MAGLVIGDVDAGPPVPLIGGSAGKRLVVKSVTFDSSYPTGGEVITPAVLGLATIDFLKAENAAGYVFEYDRTGGKLLAKRSGAANAVLAEESNGVDLSAVATRVTAIGNAA